MKNILELLYDQPGKTHGQDSPFVRTARIKLENMEMLNATMTDEQKELLEADFEVETKIEGMLSFDSFRYAFLLRAQLMVEPIEVKADLLGLVSAAPDYRKLKTNPLERKSSQGVNGMSCFTKHR